jgi:ketopantoate reductase
VGRVSQTSIGILLKVPEIRKLLLGSMREVYWLANDQDVKLAYDCLQKTISVLESLPITSTTSMQQGLLNGKPSELDE